MPTGPIYPGGPSRAADLVGGCGPERLSEHVLELELVHAVVASDHHKLHFTVGKHDRESLQECPCRKTERVDDRVDCGHPGRRDKLRRVERARQRDRLRIGARDLEVGCVTRSARDLVLAGRTRRHVLVGPVAPHHPDVRLDAVPLQPTAVHHPVIRVSVAVVCEVKPLAVAVECVRILHHELARPQHAGPRPRLVALLDLEVIKGQWQLAIGLHSRRDVPGDDLLVGHREHHVGAPAVLELEQLLDLVAARSTPRLGRVQDRHQHLLAADRIHLLAHDLHDPLVYAPAGRQPRPQSGADLPDQACADHQNVRQSLGVGWRLALSGEEVGRQQRHARGSLPGTHRAPPGRSPLRFTFSAAGCGLWSDTTQRISATKEPRNGLHGPRPSLRLQRARAAHR